MTLLWYIHSDLFWEFWGGRSLGLLYGVFLFVHDWLITHLSWKIHVRPKRSNFKWPWFFILYVISRYENSATYEHFWSFSHSIVHRWCCFHMKIWDIKWKLVFWKFSCMTLFGRISKCAQWAAKRDHAFISNLGFLLILWL